MIDVGLRPKITITEGQNAARIRHDIKTLHGFRKFYDTEMTKAGVNLLWVELLEGHDIKLKESYFKPSESDLLEGNDKMLGYIAGIDALTIDPVNKLKKELDELRSEKDDWKETTKQLNSALDQLRAQGIIK